MTKEEILERIEKLSYCKLNMNIEIDHLYKMLENCD